MLLIHPVEKNEKKLPSPYQLRRKILLKHKKLPEGQDESSFLVRNEDAREMDLRNTVKNGIMYLEDPVDKDWNPHFFVLTQNKLIYTDSTDHVSNSLASTIMITLFILSLKETDREDEEESTSSFQGGQGQGVSNDELHFSEKWFHGKLAGGREEAEQLLRTYSYLGDGTFLVRDSKTFVGDYCLSFWRNNRVEHCRIKLKQERGQTKFYLIETTCFDSLYSLITHYRSHPLRSREFAITLQEPVPQPNKHVGKEWYHPQITRHQAEEMLKRVPYDGAFLVRPSEKDINNSFAISFRLVLT